MTNWTDGYVAEIDYTHGYYSNLSPNRLRLAALIAQTEVLPSAKIFNYLELGYGQGLSINIHAASNVGTFWGNDFNPAQAANAQSLALASGADLTATEDSFVEFANRNDIPDFDIIVMHGIWSWISDKNRNVIIETLRRKLKPGGILAISYNVLPGWSASIPLRNLMTEYAENATNGSILQRIEASMAFAQKLVDAGAAYFKIHPAALTALQQLKDKPPKYLAHEYFNADWHPMPFSRTVKLLSDAKLTYVTSSHLLDHIDGMNLSEDALKFIKEISDPIFRETVRDYFTCQHFRRDIYVKGPRAMSILNQATRLKELPFMLLVHPEDREKKAKGILVEAELQDEIYSPICETLASDNYRPKSIIEMAKDPRCSKLNLNQFAQAITVLCGIENAAPVFETTINKTVKQRSRDLNDELCRRAEANTEVGFLAAPLIGAGVSVNRIEQLFMRAEKLKQSNVPEWVMSLFQAQGQRIVLDGKTIENTEDNIAEINTRYTKYKEKRRPILERLGVL